MSLRNPTADRRFAADRRLDRHRRRARVNLETLEGRQLMTTGVFTPPLSSAPLTRDNVLVPTAAVIGRTLINGTTSLYDRGVLTPMENTLVDGVFPNSATLGFDLSDAFNVYLNARDVLDVSVDVEYNYGPTPTTSTGNLVTQSQHHDSRLLISGPAGPIANVNTDGSNPTFLQGDPFNDSHWTFQAPTSGYYRIQVGTDHVEPSAPFGVPSQGISYTAALRLIQLDPTPDKTLDPNHNPADADKLGFQGGGLYAFIDPANPGLLDFGGPTGRGFQVQGNWQSSPNTSSWDGGINFTATGNLSLLTSVGQIPLVLPAGTSFAVLTIGLDHGLYGLVTSTQVSMLGLNLDSVTSLMNKDFQYNVDGAGIDAPHAGWGIDLGAAVTQATSTSTSAGAPTNPAVPYIYYSANTTVGVHYGGVSVSRDGTGYNLSVVFDPEDPMLYVDIQGLPGVSDVGFAGSLNDLIPYYPQETLSGGINGQDADFYGDLYVRAELNLADLTDEEVPVILDGAVTVNLDPNHLGLTGSALRYAQDFKHLVVTDGSTPSLVNLANDLKNVEAGVDGSASLALSKDQFTLQMQVADASAEWLGPQNTISFHAHAKNLSSSGDTMKWSLSDYLTVSEIDVAATVNVSNGQFDFKLGGDLAFLGQNFASASIDINNQDISITGNIWFDTGDQSWGPFWGDASGNAWINMTVYYDGNVSLSGGGDFSASGGWGKLSGSFDVSFGYSETFNIHDLATSLWDDFKDDVIDTLEDDVKSWFS